MGISIFGLGYVGSVTAACFAKDGHQVIGVDVADAKVEALNAGRAPIIEKDLDTLIAEAVQSKRLHATKNAHDAVMKTEISLICVGTPSSPNGNLGTAYLQQVCEEIGAALRDKTDFHTVVVRSTVLPGTLRNLVIPTLEHISGKKAGIDFGICNNPEFLRESTAVYDYYNPPKTVIGATDPKSAEVVASLYKHLNAPLIVTDIEVAELVKYADNAWHAVKVAFANEIGVLAKSYGVDGHAVMDIFCKDTKLNLSSYYMKPGFAFGGSCLPKDVRALNYAAKSQDLNLPLLASVLTSNNVHIDRGIDIILKKNKQKIGILGFSFKAGTDDLRESPLVNVIETLIGKGKDLKLYDKNVNLAKLVGANKEYILHYIPHISRLMTDSIDAVLEHAEVIVIGNGDPAFQEVLLHLKPGQEVIDFVRITNQKSVEGSYDGICW
jgi:GDP-mannose 6-dehydrogenase